MKKNILLIIIATLSLFPICCNALEEIKYEDAMIKFNIDNDAWKVTNLATTTDYKDREWTCNCGYLTTGTYDIYDELSIKERKGLNRKQYNYNVLFNDEDYVENLLLEFKDTYSIKNWNYENYEMKFIHFSGTYKPGYIEMDYDIYLTINNGFVFMFKYDKPHPAPIIGDGGKGVGKMSYENCKNPILEIVLSAQSTVENKNIETNVSDIIFIIGIIGLFSFAVFLGNKKLKDIRKVIFQLLPYAAIMVIGILLAAVNYKRCFHTLNHGICTLFKLNYGILYALGYNIIIIIALLLIFFKVLRINKLQKKNGSNNKKHKQQIVYQCSKCGKKFNYDFDVCPNCNFDFSITKDNNYDSNDNTENIADNTIKKDTKSKKENISNNSNIDRKYSDLNKLKELLDKEIITKEEFEKEKKKILKD